MAALSISTKIAAGMIARLKAQPLALNSVTSRAAPPPTLGQVETKPGCLACGSIGATNRLPSWVD